VRGIRAPQDFWAGVLFAALGVGFALLAQRYSMGSAARIGPGYFPAILGGVLALFGLVLVVRSLAVAGLPLGGWHWRSLTLIPCSIAVFILGLESLGFVVASFLSVFIASLASRRFALRRALPLAAGLAVFSALVFVRALKLQMPLWPSNLPWS
jgi:hypothetical protein